MKSEFRVLITGSFDPITVGHLDIIERASKMFDTVYVVMFVNKDKKYMFTEEQRLAFIKKACEHLPNVIADSSSGMVIDYAVEHDISAIIRGIRGGGDIFYERDMAAFNFGNSGVETLILTSKKEYEGCSSTLVRGILKAGGDPEGLLPECILELVKKSLK